MHEHINNKIAWMITTMGYGDSLLYWEPVIKGYLQYYPNTLIFTSGTKRSSDGTELPVLNAVHLHRFLLRRQNSVHPRQLILIHPRIIRDILRYRPKLLILSEFGLLTVYGILAASLIPGVKILLLVESNPKSVAGVKSSLRVLLRRLICWKCNRILTNNNDGRDYLVNELRIMKDKISVGPYLVSQPIESGAEKESLSCNTSLPPKPDNKIIFLFVGRLIEGKGIQNLIEAVDRLPKEYRQKLEIWLAGDGPYRDELTKRIHATGLGEQIHMLGYIPYNKLHRYYANADVFVFPSLGDYRGLVGFEAIVYGLAMLHSKLDGAASEVVQQGINGFTFDPRNTSELSEHIKWYLDNPEKLKDFAQHSKQLSEKYTVENAVSVLSTAIERTINA